MITLAIGERIRTFRNLRNMTLRWLGMAVGFPEKTADIRMAQYEKGTRTPKEDLTNKLAEVLDVSPRALDVPDIDSEDGLMHTLFALEDIYGLTIGEFEGRTCLYLNRNAPDWLRTAMNDWKQEARKFHNDEISKDEYDRWRYRFSTSAGDATNKHKSLEPKERRGLREFLKDESSGLNLDAFKRR